jgi:nicotinamide riboside kinase
MKQNMIILLIFLATYTANCFAAGMFYANYKFKSVIAKDYQLLLHNDTVWIYDGSREVGRYTSTWKNQMDSIILKDNE